MITLGIPLFTKRMLLKFFLNIQIDIKDSILGLGGCCGGVVGKNDVHNFVEFCEVCQQNKYNVFSLVKLM